MNHYRTFLALAAAAIGLASMPAPAQGLSLTADGDGSALRALRIKDATGATVLEMDNDGAPLTDVHLPGNNYRVLARYSAVQRSETVELVPARP